MARTRTIQIAGLNIAMHSPHSAEGYIDLIKAVYRRRAFVKLGQLHGAMLGSLYPTSRDDPLKGYSGEIYRFLKIDVDQPWFNIETQQAATPDEVTAVRIPEKLLPHLQRIPFTFNVKRHKLYFVRRDKGDSLGPEAAKKIFDELISPLVANGRFPEVVVTVLPDQDSLEHIFNMPILESLYIRLERPNSDDGDDEQQDWLRRLEKQGARRMEAKLVASKNSTIEPDSYTRSMAIVASENGHVYATGRNAEGTKVEESTSKKPMVERLLVESNIEVARDVLERFAADQR